MSNLYVFLASGDLNGDGMLDLIASVDPNGGTDVGFDVFLGNSDGSLSTPTRYAGCDGFARPALGDLNGDGLPDIVVSVAGGVNVFVQLTSGGFAAPVFYPLDEGVRDIGLGDFNGDGHLDLAVAYFDAQGGVPAGVEVLLNEEAGTFLSVGVQPGGAGSWGGMAVADVNQDGLVDIASWSADLYSVILLTSEGDGGFTVATTDTSGAALGQVVAYTAALGPLDLAMTTTNEFETLINNGGFDTLNASYGLPYDQKTCSFLAVGDFNDDGIADLAISCSPAQTANGGVFIFYGIVQNSGAPEFTPARDTAVGDLANGLAPLGPVDHPRALAMANVNGGITVYGDASRH
jgi:hypothetical protein